MARVSSSDQAMMDDNFKFGANASIAAGPVGRHAAAATDAKLLADILSYSRSKGAFAGISLDGNHVDAAECTSPPPIPALSGWGVIVFMALMGLMSIYYLRR